jgi:hypothetical protein
MKRIFLAIAVLIAGVTAGYWPENAASPTANSETPVRTEPPPTTSSLAEWKSTGQAAEALPDLAKALNLPPGAAQEEALLLTLLDLPNSQLPTALSLLLPTARGPLASAIAKQWATADPLAAKTFASSPAGLAWMRSEHGGSLQFGIMTGLAQNHQASAVELAHQIGGPYPLQNLFSALWQHDPNQALQWAQQEPGMKPENMRLMECDVQSASQITALQDGPMKRALLKGAFDTMHSDALGDPNKISAVFTWWQSLSAPDRLASLATAFSDPESAEWGESFTEKLSGSDLESLQGSLVADPKLRQNVEAIKSVATLAGLKDPAAAMSWANTTLSGRSRMEALSSIIAIGVPKSLEQLGPFLDTVPPGPLRDQAAEAALERGKYFVPENFARWAESRTDPGERKVLLTTVLGRWADADPAAAARYLTTDIPAGRQASLAKNVLGKLPELKDQLALAKHLPEGLAVTALEQLWSASPPDASEITKAAQGLPAGLLQEALLGAGRTAD